MTALLRAEWTTFRSRGRLVAMAAAALLIILFGVLPTLALRASCSEGPVEVDCPSDPVGPDGRAVSDQFFFAHRSLGENGTITVRMTSMTGVITYPPPNHDQIVTGLVPWAKAGIIIKDGLGQGSEYAALMMTGSHGVRMQYGYTHDTAGQPGSVSQSPRWLRLTRSGPSITGYESVDGEKWAKVGTARLAGLPSTVQIGLFATSPGDLSFQSVGLGAKIGQMRFTQATGVFDHVSLTGTGDRWSSSTVGKLGQTDWEKQHRAAGLVEHDGTLTVTGSGDIGPIGTEGGRTVESSLVGLGAALIVLIVLAVRFADARRTGTAVLTRPALTAKVLVLGAVTFSVGLAAAVIAVLGGQAVIRHSGLNSVPVSALTELRVIVCAAALLAVSAVFALAVGALFRRRWPALLVALPAVVLSYLFGVIPLLPEPVSDWILRLTPAAGFAMLSTVREYPQVITHYAPYAGYFPLPGWAGGAVLCGYAAVAFGLAVRRLPREEAKAEPPMDWR